MRANQECIQPKVFDVRRAERRERAKWRLKTYSEKTATGQTNIAKQKKN